MFRTLLLDTAVPVWKAGYSIPGKPEAAGEEESRAEGCKDDWDIAERATLLVREDWLKKALNQGGWALVIGWLGEKTLFSDWKYDLVGQWTEMNGVGSFGQGGFKIASETVKQVSQRTDGGG